MQVQAVAHLLLPGFCHSYIPCLVKVADEIQFICNCMFVPKKLGRGTLAIYF